MAQTATFWPKPERSVAQQRFRLVKPERPLPARWSDYFCQLTCIIWAASGLWCADHRHEALDQAVRVQDSWPDARWTAARL